MQNVDVQIRKATKDDLDGIFLLEEEWKQEEVSYIFEPITKEEFIETMDIFSDYHLVAVENRQIIGYINAKVQNSGNERVFRANEDHLMVENLYVRSSKRKSKVGSMLLETLLMNARKNGMTKFAVATDTKDMEAILKFYTQHGFKPFHVQLFKIE